MKKKIFMMLCASLFATSTFALPTTLTIVWQESEVPEISDYTDPVVEQTITDDDTPL